MTTQRIPLIARPWCASVADTPISLTRRFIWLAITALSIVGLWFHWSGWAIALAALLLPDVPLFLPRAWADRQRLNAWVVPYYNATHAVVGPLVLFASALLVQALDAASVTVVIAAACGWLCHIAVDRVAGYDLRDADGNVRSSKAAA